MQSNQNTSEIDTPLVEHHKWSVERLNEDIAVYISENHRFGTDAFLLADFAKPRHKDRVCDLGTGCGIIPLVICKRFSPKSVVGVDIQAEAIELFKQSIAASKTATVLTAIHAPMQALTTLLPSNGFDIVTCNPPYKVDGSGIMSVSESDKVARHETQCTIDDVCSAASKLLQFGGKLCICQRPERLLDVLEAMRRSGIEPKRIRFVAKDSGGAPWLFLAEGKKGAKPFLQVEPTFYLYSNGEQTDAIRAVYNLI